MGARLKGRGLDDAREEEDLLPAQQGLGWSVDAHTALRVMPNACHNSAYLHQLASAYSSN